MLVIQNQPHRAGADLGRKLVRRLACHGSTFSRVGASEQPGAVNQPGYLAAAQARQMIKAQSSVNIFDGEFFSSLDKIVRGFRELTTACARAASAWRSALDRMGTALERHEEAEVSEPV